MEDILETPLELTETTCNAIIEIPKGTNKKMEMSMEKPNHPIVRDKKNVQARFVPQVYHDLYYQTPKGIYDELVNFEFIHFKKYMGKEDDVKRYFAIRGPYEVQFDRTRRKKGFSDEEVIEKKEYYEKQIRSFLEEGYKFIQALGQIQPTNYNDLYSKAHRIVTESNTRYRDADQIIKYTKLLDTFFEQLSFADLLSHEPSELQQKIENIKAKYTQELGLNPEILEELYGEHFDKGYNLFHYGALPQTYEDPTVSYTQADFITTFGITEEEEQNKLKDIDDKQMTFDGLTGDGDPLDVCILDENPSTVESGKTPNITILGVFAMIDDGEIDWKVLGIINLPEGISITTYKSSPAFTAKIQNIRRWFKYYKCSLDDNGNITDGKVQISDLLSQEVAYKVIEHYHKNYTSNITAGRISYKVIKKARKAIQDIPIRIAGYKKQIQGIKALIESEKKKKKYNIFLSSFPFPIKDGRGGGRKSTRKRKQSRRKTKKQKKQKNRRKSRKSRKSRK